MTTIDFTPLLQAVIALIATVITAVVIPWIRARTTAQQQALLGAVTDVLVRAAEQLYGASKGPEKLRYVADELEKRGYKVDVAAIEAAVRGMNLESGEAGFQK
ncbi:phage holin, LLH family [Bacillota bacterium Meth-B3]